MVISAGGLKLNGTVGDRPISAPAPELSVYVPLGRQLRGRLVAENLRATDILRLPEGSYHVVSTYGDANAYPPLRRAGGERPARRGHAPSQGGESDAEAGCPRPGGEAFAGTAFTVLTPGGDVIREAIGAFPEVILAEGEYVLIARQGGQVHTQEFRIESGLDRTSRWCGAVAPFRRSS